MIRFLRNIRQKLAAENNVAKYLRYAIGEIVLVVIGILIALQVNNWKENIKNNELEKITLENIRSDLILQLEIINEQLRFEKAKIAEADTAALFLSLEKLNSILVKLSERRTFIANKTSYISMDSKGERKPLRNSKLQNAIVQYYQQLDYVTQVINNNNLFIVDSQFGFFVSNNSLNIKLNENGSFDHNQKLSPEKQLLLKNQLDTRKLVSENIHKLCFTQLEETKNLIQLINKEFE